MGTYQEFVTLSFFMEECCSCGIKFGMPTEWREKKRRNKTLFYCPNGHSQHYTGETQEDKLRRERDIAKQQLARAEQEAADAQKRVELLQKQKRRLEKRAAAGTCPCCQRTFSNMSTHMKKQHPEFVAENVVPLKKAKA